MEEGPTEVMYRVTTSIVVFHISSKENKGKGRTRDQSGTAPEDLRFEYIH